MFVLNYEFSIGIYFLFVRILTLSLSFSPLFQWNVENKNFHLLRENQEREKETLERREKIFLERKILQKHKEKVKICCIYFHWHSIIMMKTIPNEYIETWHVSLIHIFIHNWHHKFFLTFLTFRSFIKITNSLEFLHTSKFSSSSTTLFKSVSSVYQLIKYATHKRPYKGIGG